MLYKNFLKKNLIFFLKFFSHIIIKLFTIIKLQFILEVFFIELNNRKKIIKNKNNTFIFDIKNNLLRYRVDTFFTKEPLTINWINKFDENSIFWDIGANIGLYSIYASKTKNAKSIAFEPSVYNLDTLVNNVINNKLNDQISVVPFWIKEDNSKVSITYNDNIAGSANLGEIQHSPINKIISYGLSLDYLQKLYALDFPNYIKIDVDGAEIFILKGAQNVINNAKEILIEVDQNNDNNKKIENFLINNNFKKLVEEKSQLNSLELNTPVNQLWKKNES